MRTACSILVVVVATAACKDTASPVAEITRIRVVNSVFQGSGTTSAVPVAVDVLIDSSMSGAGLSALAAASISAGSGSDLGAGAHGGTTNLFPAAGYRDFPSGLHSFIARVTGTAASFFQTGSGEYLPKQFMLPFPYTLILAGVDTTSPPDPAAVPWAMIADDPFTPPGDAAGGLTARVQVINAAPMADPSGGGTNLTAILAGGTVVDTVTASYRASSGYVNPVAGTYTLTIMTASDTLYTGSVTLAKGEVRSFIVQSTAYAAVPGPGNTKVTNLLDNQW